MTKALIGNTSGLIRGLYNPPLTFSIANHYIIDIPNFLNVIPSDQMAADLVSAKNAAWAASVASTFTPTTAYDELLISPNIDFTVQAGGTSGVISGQNKRTAILPGGTLLTNPITVPSPGSGKHVLLHYYGFILYRAVVDPNNTTSPTPAPPQLLYNYDPAIPGFSDFLNSNFTVTLCNGAFPFASILTFPSVSTPGAIISGVTLPSTVRLQFKNVVTETWNLSEWILMFG